MRAHSSCHCAALIFPSRQLLDQIERIKPLSVLLAIHFSGLRVAGPAVIKQRQDKSKNCRDPRHLLSRRFRFISANQFRSVQSVASPGFGKWMSRLSHAL